jgi:hypothetical protein
MKILKIVLLIIATCFTYLAKSNDKTCSLECPSGKTISIEPCWFCTYGSSYINCDGDYLYCGS